MDNAVKNPFARGDGAYDFPVGDQLRGERATLGKTLLDVQRDLLIKAAFIAAIEDGDISVFPSKGVIPGYVRSYARYLHLDGDEIYCRFCQENSFSPASGVIGDSVGAGHPKTVGRPAGNTFRPDFPLARAGRISLPSIPFSAIGSLVVLVSLVAGLGYGGLTVIRNIQRVQFAPVEELPLAVSEVDQMTAPNATAPLDPTLAELSDPVTSATLADLYRHQESAAPTLVPRDGPIAAIDPDRLGRLAERPAAPAVGMGNEDPDALIVAAAVADAIASGDDLAAQTEAADTPAVVDQPVLTVVAERAAWIRVYLDNGTIIFERILERGETYSPPAGVGTPLIWAGNSGSVYVRVGEELHGPIGRGTRAARDVPLDPVSITQSFARVEQVPEIISQTIGADAPLPAASVAIQ